MKSNDTLKTSIAEIPTPAAGPELTIVVPTFNEAMNVGLLVDRLRAVLAGVDWEVIFVDDDSPDGTAGRVKAIGQTDRRVRCIRRIGRRGLSGACIEGMLASQASYVCVMDADLQHDETVLPRMLALLREGKTNLVVASRYLQPGGAEALSRSREWLSRAGTSVVQRFLHVELRDPLSGFFAMRRTRFDAVAEKLSPDGFKILLEIVAIEGRRLEVTEISGAFGKRLHGESKLDNRVALDFVALVVSRLSRNLVPQRFLMFCAVGFTGIFVHLLALNIFKVMGLSFAVAQTFAALVAMSSNFWLNNILTYRDCKLRGWAAVKGFALFVLVCSFGFASNISVAEWVFRMEHTWLLAGFAGAAISAVWNYAVSAALVWRR
jgi:dolichol-phosphate mannosyltransferase